LRDSELLALTDFYKCYRAYVRGKVTAIKSIEPEVSVAERRRSHDTAARYFQLALAYAIAGSGAARARGHGPSRYWQEHGRAVFGQCARLAGVFFGSHAQGTGGRGTLRPWRCRGARGALRRGNDEPRLRNSNSPSHGTRSRSRQL